MRLKIHDFVNIDLINPPNELAHFMEEELGYFQIDSGSSKQHNSDTVVRFVDELPIIGKREYISLYAGYDDVSLFVMDAYQHKATVPFDNLEGNCKITCEKEFNPSDLLLLLENLLRYKFVLKKAVFMHASAISYHGQGIIFPAWANTGKTNLLLQFLKDGAHYISDDFAIMAEDGFLYSYPKRLQLFDYNFAEFPQLVVALGRSVRLSFLKQKLSAKFLKRLTRVPLLTRLLKRVKRKSCEALHIRAPAKELFPDVEVDGSRRINKIFFLIRTHSESNIEIERMTPEVLANKMVPCLSFERHYPYDYRLLYEFAYPMKENKLLDKVEQMEGEIISRATKNRHIYYVRLPRDHSSLKLFRAVQQYL